MGSWNGPNEVVAEGIEVIRLGGEQLEAWFAPQIGGRIVSLRALPSEAEFVWRNAHLPLRQEAPGSTYDPLFYGGIDELLPSDVPEEVDGLPYPDHGELWTLSLTPRWDGDTLTLSGRLPICGINYERTMRIEGNRLLIGYALTNDTETPRRYLFKLHPAVPAAPGDQIRVSAATVTSADPDYSLDFVPGPRAFSGSLEIPDRPDTTDFLYFTGLPEGRMSWHSADGKRSLTYLWDPAAFPYAWYFASYGGFQGHHMAVIEPCNTIPISLLAAIEQNTCGTLAAGETFRTEVAIEVSVED